MIRKFLDALFKGGRSEIVPASRPRVFRDERPDILYAIGDVHGCNDKLEALERKIFTDASEHPGTKWLVMLGDYVDRGPKSASVIDSLMVKPRANIERLCLAGNHEDVMLHFLENPSSTHRWLEFGGRETLHSYGIYKVPDSRQKLRNLIDSHVPEEHFRFLASLPSLISIPGYCFVHAGIEDGVRLEDQQDAVLLWTRPKNSEGAPDANANGFVVVHGHTPVESVTIANNRVNVDTGAYLGGKLSAVRILRDGTIDILATD